MQMTLRAAAWWRWLARALRGFVTTNGAKLLLTVMCSPLSSCVTPEMINAPFSLGRPHIARELFEETMIKNTKVFAIIDQCLQTLPDPLCVAGRQDPSLDRCLCLQGLAGTYADELVWEKASTLIAAAVAQLDALPDRDSREMVIVRRQLGKEAMF